MLFFYIGHYAGRRGEDSQILSDALNTYRVIKFCCDCDIVHYDREINEMLDDNVCLDNCSRV